MTGERTPSLFGALPPNVVELTNEARRSADAGNPDYLPAVLCQVGLPRRAIKGCTFERASGGVSLQVEAGKVWDGTGWRQLALPYGVRPRLALVHIATQALRTRSRVIDVGASANAFLGV